MNERMFKLIKKEMKSGIEKLSFDNLEVQEELFKKYWTLCKELKGIGDYEDQHKLKRNEYIEKEETSQELKQELVHNPLDEEQEDNVNSIENLESKEKKLPTYTFERKLRGGYVPDINGFVPEGVIRRLGLQHGDLITADLIREDDDHHRFYQYELAQKGDGKEATDRVQYNYCVVKNVAGRLAVDKSEETGELIRSSEGVYTVLLEEQDINEHQIREGAIVDIAFYKSNPQRAKVLWNHKVEEIPERNEKKTLSKKKAEKEQNESSEPIEQSLTGRTILVIGDEPNRMHYDEAISNRGGTLLMADAKDKFSRVEPLVRKSDLVIFLLAVSGHTGGEHIKQMCRDHEVPFETKWGTGYTGVVRLAEEKLRIS